LIFRHLLRVDDDGGKWGDGKALQAPGSMSPSMRTRDFSAVLEMTGTKTLLGVRFETENTANSVECVWREAGKKEIGVSFWGPRTCFKNVPRPPQFCYQGNVREVDCPFRKGKVTQRWGTIAPLQAAR